MAQLTGNKTENIFVDTLPEAGIQNRVYIIKGSGGMYIWSGFDWIKTIDSTITEIDAQLLTHTYTVTGNSPTFTVSIPNISSYDELSGKTINIYVLQRLNSGITSTLNVNNLGAKPIRISPGSSALVGERYNMQIFSVYFDGQKQCFILKDITTVRPVDAGGQDILIEGNKSFMYQVEAKSDKGFGITNSNGYIYTRQDSRSADTVGDIRIKNITGGLIAEVCTVGNATKGAGIFQVTDAPAPGLILNKPFETPLAVASDTTINLLDLFSIANEGVPINSLPTQWSLVNGVLKFPSLYRRVNYNIRISISGTFAGDSPSTNRIITLTFERADGSLIIGGNNSTVTSDTLTRTTQLVIPTFTDTFVDKFSTIGTVANLLQSSNKTLNITNVQISIFGSRV